MSVDLPFAPRVAVLDVSGDGASLALPRAVLESGRLSGVLHVDGRSPIDADLDLVRHANLGSDRIEVGVRFRGLSDEAWHDLGQYLIGEFLRRQRSLERLSAASGPVLRVQDPARIGEILRLHGLARGGRLVAYRGDQPLPVRLRLGAIAAPPADLEATCDWENALEAGRAYSFLLPASGAATLFSAVVRHCRGRTVALSFPEEVLQGGFRDSLRVPARAGEHVLVSFPHRRTDGQRRARTALDMSDQGLAFSLSAGQDLLLPGDRLEDLRVEFPGGAVSALAVVRGVAPRDGSSGLACGIELVDFEGAADRRRWERYLFSKAYPRTVREGADLPRMAWEMLDSSGYLDLWTRAEDRERLGHRFERQWRWPTDLPSHLIVLKEESRCSGTFATSRLYPRTWLLHSLGVDKDARRRHGAVLDLARELYAAMLRLLKGETQGRFFVLFVQKDKRWTDLLYGGFVRTLPEGAPSVYDEFALYKCRTEDAAAPLPADAARWNVGQADHDELARVARELRTLLTPLEIEAYSYGEDEIDLASFSTDDPAELRRRVLLARDEDGPLAALVMESGSEGVNVFGLLNTCRVLFLRAVPDRDAYKGICHALLASAHEAYRAADVREFIVFATDEPMVEAAREVGGYLVSDGVRWVASCELLPAWTSYIDEVLQARAHETRTGPAAAHDHRAPKTAGAARADGN